MKPPTPGPSRAPSKPGMTIATFKFAQCVRRAQQTHADYKGTHGMELEKAVWLYPSYVLPVLVGRDSEEVKVKFILGVHCRPAWNDFLE